MGKRARRFRKKNQKLRQRRRPGKLEDARADMTAHFIKRFAERYGIVLQYDDVAELCTKILCGKFECIEVQPRQRRLYSATVKDKSCILVFDTRVNALITVLY